MSPSALCCMIFNWMNGYKSRVNSNEKNESIFPSHHGCQSLLVLYDRSVKVAIKASRQTTFGNRLAINKYTHCQRFCGCAFQVHRLFYAPHRSIGSSIWIAKVNTEKTTSNASGSGYRTGLATGLVRYTFLCFLFYLNRLDSARLGSARLGMKSSFRIMRFFQNLSSASTKLMFYKLWFFLFLYLKQQQQQQQPKNFSLTWKFFVSLPHIST